MKVRECYTAYACGFFATHADAYETSSGTSVPLVNQKTGTFGRGQQVIRTGAAARAHDQVVAAERAVAQAREAATQEREQKNSWLDAFMSGLSGAGPGAGAAMASKGAESARSLQLQGGGCIGACLDFALGIDRDRGRYVYVGTGVGVEYGASVGVGPTTGVSRGWSSGMSGSAAWGPGINLTGTFGSGPYFSGGSFAATPGAGWRYGFHFTTGYTWTER